MSAAALERLTAALEDGEKSILDLRKGYELDPMLVGRLCFAHPDRFVSFDKSGKCFIRLREPLSAVDEKLFGLLKGAKAGLSLPRLWSSHKIKTEESKSFATRFGEVAVIIPRKTREGKLRDFLMLKREVLALPETPEPLPQPAQDDLDTAAKS